MRILVTGSAGHLGEALLRKLHGGPHQAIGMDRLGSPFTTHVGSVTDEAFVRDCMQGIDWVLHTATLHKPHIATHSRADFVQTNITGTLNLLEAALQCGVSSFVFTSTTSTFGATLMANEDTPVPWITEKVVPLPKNIYGATKIAAEELCSLFSRRHGLPCTVLRTSRFFREVDDNPSLRECYDDGNIKANEFLYRRVDVEDAVAAHLLAAERAPTIGFGRFIISATTPFRREHLPRLRSNAAEVVAELFADFKQEYTHRNWKMFPGIDRVYDNTQARKALNWAPVFDFRHVLDRLKREQDPMSELACQIGVKGYHGPDFSDGVYPLK